MSEERLRVGRGLEVKAGRGEGGRGPGREGRRAAGQMAQAATEHFLLQGPLCQCTRPRGLHAPGAYTDLASVAQDPSPDPEAHWGEEVH